MVNNNWMNSLSWVEFYNNEIQKMYWLIEKARNFNDTKSVLSKINWFEMTIYQQEPDNSEYKNIVSDLYKKLDQKIAYLNSKKIASSWEIRRETSDWVHSLISKEITDLCTRFEWIQKALSNGLSVNWYKITNLFLNQFISIFNQLIHDLDEEFLWDTLEDSKIMRKYYEKVKSPNLNQLNQMLSSSFDRRAFLLQDLPDEKAIYEELYDLMEIFDEIDSQIYKKYDIL